MPMAMAVHNHIRQYVTRTASASDSESMTSLRSKPAVKMTCLLAGMPYTATWMRGLLFAEVGQYASVMHVLLDMMSDCADTAAQHT